jgi:hypothetical protein
MSSGGLSDLGGASLSDAGRKVQFNVPPPTIEPNLEILELVKMVIRQNTLVLEMNAKLIQGFGTPPAIMIRREAVDGSHQ